MQIGPPNIHRLGAAKNRRAPADALKETSANGAVSYQRGAQPHEGRPYDLPPSKG
ncbi:MAG: hypothetical protein GX456_11480 [Verrucomicrobia bacterium]|nr:hypothetical protein [Verrucomicrobiota bacterium]